MAKKQDELQFKTEKMVLGALLVGTPSTIDDAIDLLFMSDFTNTRARKLYLAICEVWNNYKSVDVVKLLQYVNDKKITEVDSDFIMDVADSVSSEAGIEVHIEWLKEKTYVRNVNAELTSFQSKLLKSEYAGDVDREKERLISKLGSITYRNIIETTNFDALYNILMNNIQEGKQLAGISTGILKLDALRGGWEKEKFEVTGGLKKSGKSRWSIYKTRKLYEALTGTSERVGFLGLEMTQFDTYKLILSSFTGIPDNHFNLTGKLTTEQKESIKKWQEKIDWSRIKLLVAPGSDRYTIGHKIRELHNLGCDWVIVDFLQRVVLYDKKGKEDENRSDGLADLCNMLADQSRKFKMHIDALSQLNNSAEKEQPTIGHLKGSGGIGESADTITLIDNLFRRFKTDTYRGRFNLHIEQRNNGSSGWVEVKGNLANCSFHEPVDHPPNVGEHNSHTPIDNNDEPF